jgi:hypothetical protein
MWLRCAAGALEGFRGDRIQSGFIGICDGHKPPLQERK